MPDLLPAEEITPVDGGAKPAPLPLATRKPGKCLDCGAPVKRFCTTAGSTGTMTYDAHRCPKCRMWFKQYTTFDRTTQQLTVDPRPVKAAPVIGEVGAKTVEG